MKAVLVEHQKLDEQHTVNLWEATVLWKEADRLAVREVILAKHRNDYKDGHRILCLIVVKSCYLVILHVKLRDIDRTSMEIISHVAFGTGPSSIISIEPVETENQNTAFIVACREGPLHLLTLEPDFSSDASCINMVGMELLSGNNDGGSIDMKNYRCHGFKKSNNGSIWVFLQNGLLDEQVKFSKGKLTFLTQQTFNAISKTILNQYFCTKSLVISD